MPATQCIIRIARPADSDAVTRVLCASYGTAWTKWHPAEALAAALPLVTRANLELLASGAYFVAECNGVVIACGGWSQVPPGGKPATAGAGHIRHFATDPGHFGKGAASAILARCVAEAAMAKVKTLHCLSSLSAEEFYDARGFKRIGAAELALSNGAKLAAVEMRRELA